MRVALVQMASQKGEIATNLTEHARQIEAAQARGVDLILFPEMSITGYIDPSRWPEAVLRVDGPEINQFVALTSASDITAVAGLVEHNSNGHPFITQIAAQAGEIVSIYRKRQIVDEEADWFAPGPPEPAIFAVDSVTVGLAACADIDNPAVYRDCARAGAQIILHASAPGLYGDQATRDWQSSFNWWRDECITKDTAHARDNAVFVAAATAAGRTIDEDFPGGGYLFGPDGTLLAATPDWIEQTLDVTIALADIS